VATIFVTGIFMLTKMCTWSQKSA